MGWNPCYQDIKLAETGVNELSERSDAWLVGYIKLMKDDKIRKAKPFEFFNSFEASLLVSGCHHYRHAL